MRTVTKTEKQEAIEKLREWIKPGQTVYTILRHVSKSGMTRHISVLVPWTDEKTGEVRFIHPNHAVSKALGWRLTTTGGSDCLVVGGCGMDMGFHLVYTLSCVLYGKNPDGSYSHEGAYSVKQEWL